MGTQGQRARSVAKGKLAHAQNRSAERAEKLKLKLPALVLRTGRGSLPEFSIFHCRAERPRGATPGMSSAGTRSRYLLGRRKLSRPPSRPQPAAGTVAWPHGDPRKANRRGDHWQRFAQAHGLERIPASDRLVEVERPRSASSPGRKLQLWRGPTDNDGIKGWEQPWKADRSVKLAQGGARAFGPQGHFHDQGDTPTAMAACTLTLEHIGFLHRGLEESCASSGDLHRQSARSHPQVENIFTVDKTHRPICRVSASSSCLKSGLEKLKWFGREDRLKIIGTASGARSIDLYESTVTDQYVPLHRAAGTRQPHRCPLAFAARMGRPASASRRRKLPRIHCEPLHRPRSLRRQAHLRSRSRVLEVNPKPRCIISVASVPPVAAPTRCREISALAPGKIPLRLYPPAVRQCST